MDLGQPSFPVVSQEGRAQLVAAGGLKEPRAPEVEFSVLERRLVEAILGAAQRQWGFCGRVSTVGEEGDKIRLCR